MTDPGSRLASRAITGAVVVVLLVYAPLLDAPFLVPKFATLELAAALGVAALLLTRASHGGPQVSRAWMIAAGLVVATTIVSWLVARGGAGPVGCPYLVDALARWAALFGVAAGVTLLSDRPVERYQLLETVALTASAVALLGLVQHVGLLPAGFPLPVFSTPGSTFGNRNLAAEIMAMALPLGVAAGLEAESLGQRSVFAITALFEVVFLAVTRARGAWLGCACGLLLVLLLERRRFLASRPTLALALAALVAAGVAAWIPGRFTRHDMGDTKRYAPALSVLEGAVDPQGAAMRTRLGFWRRTLRMLEEAPIVGVGPGNWPVLFPRYAQPNALKDGVLTTALAPRQAHNDLVERTGETGLLGLSALLFLVVATVRSAHRRLGSADTVTRGHTAGALGALAAMAGLSMASFPLEMPGTILLGGIALGLVTVPDPARKARPQRKMLVPAVALSGMMLVCSVVRSERIVRGSYWLGVAEHLPPREQAGSAAGGDPIVDALRSSLQARPDRFRALLKLSQRESRDGRGTDAIDMAKHALAIEPYSIHAWGALARAYQVAGHSSDAIAAATVALTLLPEYPTALAVRARERVTTDPAGAAEDRALLRLLTESEDVDTRRAATRALEAD